MKPERIKLDSGRDRAIRDQVERDFCLAVVANGDVDVTLKIVTLYTDFRDGKTPNPWVDNSSPGAKP